ncbi:hypothetical protein INT48_009619 [Thamnidium elegans]|uniref:Uncharacterized protein n=1 Tax=Thamnidium elegans TaxID=101142 RepID=A0A8H7VX49_9FUNG|nr:hypothetical protein INT48_009619 [Thamnidium elegans]
MDIDFDMNEISLRDEDTEAVPEIIELDGDATMELKKGHEDNEPNNSSDEEENEADARSSGNYLKEEKPLRDLAEKKRRR